MLVIPKRKHRLPGNTRRHYLPGILEQLADDLNRGFMLNYPVRAFSPALREKLYRISCPVTYPKNRILFAEGESARGVFLIERGRVKLTAESSEGRSFILHLASAHEMVGLPATLSGRCYEVTAEAIESTQVRFVPRTTFLDLIHSDAEAALNTAKLVTEMYFSTYEELRYLGLSTSAEARLARFLLAKTGSHHANGGSCESVKINLTHQQIAALIGLSRETVTRLIADFKRKGLVTVSKRELHIARSGILQQSLREMP